MQPVAWSGNVCLLLDFRALHKLDVKAEGSNTHGNMAARTRVSLFMHVCVCVKRVKGCQRSWAQARICAAGKSFAAPGKLIKEFEAKQIGKAKKGKLAKALRPLIFTGGAHEMQMKLCTGMSNVSSQSVSRTVGESRRGHKSQ